MEKHICVPFNDDVKQSLKAKDFVYLTGTIYTARDAAHIRLHDMIKNNQTLPFDLKNNVIYYMGPTPTRPNSVIGSAGPTTSERMDKYTPELLDLGLAATIGKGKRDEKVFEAIKRNKSVYFVAIGGAGALLSKAIKKCDVIAFDDLGTEAIRKLEVENLPCIVYADSQGNHL